MLLYFNLFIVFALATSISVMLVPILRSLAFRLNVLDQPDERKVHKEAIPYLGGVAIFCGYVIGVLIASVVYKWIPYQNAMIFLVSGLLIFLLGLYDDIKGSHARLKLGVQFLVAGFVVSNGIYVSELSNPFGSEQIELGLWGQVLSLFWIVGISNAINLLDGLDGLAGGVSSISILFMAGFALYTGNIGLAGLLLALLGGIIGFLVFNLPPAKIFMGDAGSLLIGFLFAVFCLIADARGPATVTIIVPVILLTMPIVDTLLAIIRRVKNKQHIFQADKKHLHHRILALSKSYRQTLVIIYAINILIGLFAAFTLVLPPDYRFFMIFILVNNLLFGMKVLKLFEHNKQLREHN